LFLGGRDLYTGKRHPKNIDPDRNTHVSRAQMISATGSDAPSEIAVMPEAAPPKAAET
jgi:hypothetical protein